MHYDVVRGGEEEANHIANRWKAQDGRDGGVHTTPNFLLYESPLLHVVTSHNFVYSILQVLGDKDIAVLLPLTLV
jgi:hypothetical protein